MARAVAATPVADLVTKERRSSSLLDGDVDDMERAELVVVVVVVVRMPVLGAKAETLDAARTRAAAAKRNFMVVVVVVVCIINYLIWYNNAPNNNDNMEM